MPQVAATYYDGRSARAHPVTLTLAGDHLSVTGTDIRRHEPLAGLHVSEPMGAAPRLSSAVPNSSTCPSSVTAV